MKNLAILTLLCSLNTIASEGLISKFNNKVNILNINNQSAMTFTVWAPRDATAHDVFEINPKTKQALSIAASEITLVCLLQPNVFSKFVKLHADNNDISINSNLFVKHNQEEIHHFTPCTNSLQ